MARHANCKRDSEAEEVTALGFVNLSKGNVHNL